MLGMLFILGITRGRFVNQKTWIVLWFSLSVMAAVFIFCSHFFLTARYSLLATGLSFGYVLGVTIHTFDHLLEELRTKKPPSQ